MNQENEYIEECSCGNIMFGFDCVCEFVNLNPGETTYSCEFCGIFTASKPRCNCCKEENHESGN